MATSYKDRSRRYYETLKGRATRLLHGCRKRAKATGREFALPLQWVTEKLEAGHCERTGLPFSFSRAADRGSNPWAPSVDRIDNTRGYTEDNVQMVCHLYNMAKSNHSDSAVMLFASMLVLSEQKRQSPEGIPCSGCRSRAADDHRNPS